MKHSHLHLVQEDEASPRISYGVRTRWKSHEDVDDWKLPHHAARVLHGAILDAGASPEDCKPSSFRLDIAWMGKEVGTLDAEQWYHEVCIAYENVHCPQGFNAVAYCGKLAHESLNTIQPGQLKLYTSPHFNRHARLILCTIYALQKTTGQTAFLSARQAAHLLEVTSAMYASGVLKQMVKNKHLNIEEAPTSTKATRYSVNPKYHKVLDTLLPTVQKNRRTEEQKN